jgi:hypothetical protein
MLEDHGHSVNTEKRRFSTLLIPKAAFPKLWVPNLANLATTLLLESSRYIPLQNDGIFVALQAVCQLKPEEALPSGGSSEIPRDLSGLLLRDVEIGITDIESNRRRHPFCSEVCSVGPYWSCTST